jgi:hypothetical protein
VATSVERRRRALSRAPASRRPAARPTSARGLQARIRGVVRQIAIHGRRESSDCPSPGRASPSASRPPGRSGHRPSGLMIDCRGAAQEQPRAHPHRTAPGRIAAI